jgi:hypothetical protein
MIGGFIPTLLLCMTRGFLVGPFLSLWAHYLAVFKPQVIFLFYYFHVPTGGGCGRRVVWGLGEGRGGGGVGGGFTCCCHFVFVYKRNLCVCVCFFFLAMATHVPHIHPPSIISLGFKMVSN